MRILPLLLVGLAFSCGGPASSAPATPPITWSEPADGLQVGLQLPAEVAERSVTATLHFRNVSDAPVRIYLLQAEPFRGAQSVFHLRDRAAAPVPDPHAFQPPPRAHGIRVGESDFQLIDPGQTRTFPQTVTLPAPGVYDVTWEYRNAVERWEGGRQTLDGPTEELFGGGPIPHIWLGSRKVATSLVVE